MPYKIVDLLFQVYMLMLFAKILGSWVPDLQRTKAMQFVSFYTDPYLNFFRGFIPPLGMIDLSPIVAFLALGVLEQFVKALLQMLLT